jgi:hypothetical protein
VYVSVGDGAVLVDALPVTTVGSFSILQDPQGAYLCMFQGE